jgi:hypothetical protein
MKVWHISATGIVRAKFENVSSIHPHAGNSIVSINRKGIIVVNTPDLRLKYEDEYPVSLINLAPGESVESIDEPAKV